MKAEARMVSRRAPVALVAPAVLFLGLLLVLPPGVAVFFAVILAAIMTFPRIDDLLIVAILFAVVSTLPGLDEGGTRQVTVAPGVATDLRGLTRIILTCAVMLRLGILAIQQRGVLRHNYWFIAGLTYVAVSLAWTTAIAGGEALRTVLYFALTFSIYFLTAQVSTQPSRASRLVKWLLATAVVVALASLMASSYEPTVSENPYTEDRGDRLAGIAASPNLLAGNLAIFIAVGLSFFAVSGLPSPWRLMGGATALVCMVPLVLTFSRSGWLGAMLAAATIAVFTGRWRWLVGGGAAVVAVLLFTVVGDRFLGEWRLVWQGVSLADARGFQNAYGRIELLWKPAIDALLTPATSLTGNGAGTAQTWAWQNVENGLHSELLQDVIDFGVIGTGLFVLGFSSQVRRSWRLLRTASPMAYALGLASLGALAAMTPKFAWDHVFNGPNGWFLAMAFGLAAQAHRWARPMETMEPSSVSGDAV
jgi:hypothetical protein